VYDPKPAYGFRNFQKLILGGSCLATSALLSLTESGTALDSGLADNVMVVPCSPSWKPGRRGTLVKTRLHAVQLALDKAGAMQQGDGGNT